MKYQNTLYLFLIFIFINTGVFAQNTYSVKNVHAHNDYHQPIPFHTAYHRQVGSMEADVFLQNGELFVAHDLSGIRPEQTLESVYLKPLQAKIKENKGHIYPEANAGLQLLIDLKTPGKTTLPVLVKMLEKYPEISQNPKVNIVISGNKPAPATWPQFPEFIHFDGTPGERYTLEQLKRVALVSASFRKYSQWNGKGLIVKDELKKINHLIDSIHHLNKPFRFWATPDNVNTWQTLISLKADYLGTDDVIGLTDYLKKLPASEYQSKGAHVVYNPKYVHNDKRKKVKNVILLIGDGMGLAQIYAGYTAASGQLNLFNFLNIGLSKTASADSYNTDSAAGGTAMATGQKTNNRYIGVDYAGKPLASIPELIAAKGMKSALISSGDITDATPASFYAHQLERGLNEAIASDFLKSPVDILIGGNFGIFSKQKDGRNLIPELQKKGYFTSCRFSSLDSITASKFVVLDNAAVVSTQDGRGHFLTKAFHKSVQVLSKNKKGFFIMAEGALIDRGGHMNNTGYMVQEMLDFDQLVGEAMKFVDEDGETLLIVTADHETGGASLLNGNIRNGYVVANFSTDDHTAIPVPVFAYGPHSLDFRGVYENTELFQKIMHVINLYHK